MGGSFSRNKGQRGEREVLQMFLHSMERVETETGLAGDSARIKRNTLQSDRGGDDLHGIPLVSVEVKRAEVLSLNSWWQQCARQAEAMQQDKPLLPVLFFRQNRKPWRVMTYTAITDKYNVARFYVVSSIGADEFLQGYRILYALELRERQTAREAKELPK